jgi:hypothetical protein
MAVRKQFHQRTGRPSGPEWQKLSRLLWKAWGPGVRCYYCEHPILRGPRGQVLGEIAHLVSPIVAPQLAWEPRNLRPSHGCGARRCREPSCMLACNWLAHNSPDAPKSPADGRDLPFTPEFRARQAAEAASFLAKRVRQGIRARGRGSDSDPHPLGNGGAPLPSEIGRIW